MKKITQQQIRMMLDRTGIKVTEERIKCLKKTFDEYHPYLTLLHSINVENREVASVFHPELESH